MNSTVMNRRKIERYAQLLDEAGGGPRRHSRSPDDDELLNLVSVADQLGATGADVRPTESFRQQTRAFLMATAEREGIGRTAKPEAEPGRRKATARALPKRGAARPGRTRIRARGAILVGLAVGTLALSGMSAASGSAMPGDTLYGLKRSQENAQLALASSDASKGKLYLDFARTRAGEAWTVRTDPALLKSTLADMDSETEQGVSLLVSDAITHDSTAALTTIDRFAVAQNADIDKLLNAVPDSDRAIVAKSATVVGEAALRSSDVRKVLGCAHVPTTGSDEFGPTVGTTCASAAGINPASPLQPESTAPGSPSGRSTTSPAGTTAGATTTMPNSPEANPAWSRGLLGDISHLLGGLIGR